MNLFLVEYNRDYSCYDYSGIFSTREKAEEYIRKFHPAQQKYFAIEEVTVDEP